jgi:hypothetical protein
MLIVYIILERRTAPNDSSLIPSNNTDVSVPSNSAHTMTMSTTSHPSSNPSLFAYRSTLTAGTSVRQRALVDTTTTSLFIATEKLKTNISSSMRPARQPLTGTTTTMSSAYMPSQQLQRNVSQNTKQRIQQDKCNNSKGKITFFSRQKKNLVTIYRNFSVLKFIIQIVVHIM